MKRGLSTAALLLASAVLGSGIVLTDKNIWRFEPSHAYGLIAFVAVDLSLMGLVALRPSKRGLLLAAVWGLVQALIMLSDVATGPASFGLSAAQFAVYLFGLGYYDSSHIPYLFPALFIVNVLESEFAYFDWRRLHSERMTLEAAGRDSRPASARGASR
jgi:hypothetical protein